MPDLTSMAPISAKEEYLPKKITSMKDDYLAKKNRPQRYSMDRMKDQMQRKLLTLFSESEDHLRHLINTAEKEWITKIEILFPAQTDEEMKWLRKEMRSLEKRLYKFQIKYYDNQMLFLKRLFCK